MYRLMTFVMFAATCISCMQSQPGSGELQNKPSVLNADTSNGDNETSSVYASQQVSASSGGTMSVSEESMNESLRGVTISIPPGALAIDTTIVIKEVTDVANSVTLSALNIPGGAAAGPSVAIEASDMDALTGTIAISIPYDPGASLTQGTPNIAVIGVFRSGNSYAAETYVGNELNIEGKFIKLSISKFGAYQAMTSSEPVEKKKVETSAGYVEKHIAKKAGTENYVAFLVQNPQDLPECDATRLSHLYYVLASSMFYSCNGTSWAEVNIKGAKGDTGAKGEAGTAGAAGANGAQGAAGVGIDPSQILTRMDNNARFGYLKGFGSQIWVESDSGYYTGLDVVGVNYDVQRKTLYYSERDCSGKKFTSSEGLPYDFRRIHYTFSNQHPVGRISASTGPFPVSSVIRAGEPCHNIASIVPVKDGVKPLGGFVTHNNLIYFSGSTQDNVQELWVSNGTANGTQMVKDLDGNPATGSGLGSFTVVENKIFFVAYNIGNAQLWTTSGTSSNTIMLTAGHASIYPIKPVGDKLLFNTYSATSQSELWISNGTPGGTYKIGNGVFDQTYAYGSVIATTESKLYFTMYNGSAYDLWQTDLTTDAMINLTGSAVGWENGNIYQDKVATSATGIYFAANNKIWFSDGVNPTNTRKAIHPDGMSSLSFPYGASYRKSMQIVGNDAVFFGACTGGSGICNGDIHLWRWDGSVTGGLTSIWTLNSTFVVSDNLLKLSNGMILFEAPTSENKHLILSTDGTNSNELIELSSSYDGNGISFRLVGQNAVFTKNDNGHKIFSTNGTGAPTVLASATGTASGFHFNDNITSINNRLYYLQENSGICYGGSTDGTSTGTSTLVPINTDGTYFSCGWAGLSIEHDSKLLHRYNNGSFYLFSGNPLSIKLFAKDQNSKYPTSAGNVLFFLDDAMYSSADKKLYRYNVGTNDTTDADVLLIPIDFTEVSELNGSNPLPIGTLLKKAQ